jgi:hypothetical protein
MNNSPSRFRYRRRTTPNSFTVWHGRRWIGLLYRIPGPPSARGNSAARWWAITPLHHVATPAAGLATRRAAALALLSEDRP